MGKHPQNPTCGRDYMVVASSSPLPFYFSDKNPIFGWALLLPNYKITAMGVL